MSHRARTLANVQSLSNLTATVIAKIDTNIYSISARKMNEILGETEYDVYTALQVETSVVNEIEAPTWTFEDSSSDGRKLKNLELAEAYCILYYLSIVLRKIDIDTFMTEAETWGEGSINPIDIKSIISYGDRYLVEAKILARPYGGDTGGVGLAVI